MSILRMCALIAYLVLALIAQADTPLMSEKMLELGTVMQQVQHYYIDELSADDIANKAISGLMKQLDPHSEYLDQGSYAQFESIHDGVLHGIGIEITKVQDELIVVTPIDNSPAAKAGVQAGDIITHIDDKLVHTMSFAQAVEAISGKQGTKVRLHLLRKQHPEPIKLSITRGAITIPAVKSAALTKHIGYIRISMFNEPMAGELKVAIQTLQKSCQPLQGIVLDLRNNPGGLLDSTVAATRLFLDKSASQPGPVIVSAKDRNPVHNRTYYADDSDITSGVPIAVLINQGSASGAEIMAAALAQNRRAVLLGESSFGKGSIQTVIPLQNSSALKLTTGLYHTPNGKTIQGVGITPDIPLVSYQVDQQATLDIREHLHHHSIGAADSSTQPSNSSQSHQAFIQAQDVLAEYGFVVYQALTYLLTSQR